MVNVEGGESRPAGMDSNGTRWPLGTCVSDTLAELLVIILQDSLDADESRSIIFTMDSTYPRKG